MVRFPGFPAILGALVALLGGPAAQAGDELQNCFVERIPCGTPAQLAETLRRCLANPGLCGAEPRLAPLAAAPASDPHGTLAAAPPRAADIAAQGMPGPVMAEIRRVAGLLPLPASIAQLKDRVPQDPEGAIRSLGLRASPTAAVTDFRGHAPSVEELTRALLR